MELHQIDVLEVEPLGAVDGEHLDGVLGAVLGPALLGLARLGHAPAQRAQDRRGVAAAVLDGRQDLAEEAVEVGQAVGTEVAGGLGGLDQMSRRRRSDEDVRRLGCERPAQDRQGLDGGQEVLLPARVLDAVDAPARLRGTSAPWPPPRSRSRRPSCEGALGRVGDARASSVIRLGKLAVPQRDQGRVGHADRGGAEHGEQRQVVPGIEHAPAPGPRPR